MLLGFLNNILAAGIQICIEVVLLNNLRIIIIFV